MELTPMSIISLMPEHELGGRECGWLTSQNGDPSCFSQSPSASVRMTALFGGRKTNEGGRRKLALQTARRAGHATPRKTPTAVIIIRVTAQRCASEMSNKPNVNPTEDTDDSCARVLLKCCVGGLFNPNESTSILCMHASKLHLCHLSH